MKTKDRDKFREFVKILKEDQIRHWVEVAIAVGTSEATISRWRRLPEAQDHISLAVVRTIERMEEAGKKDWRMWEAKLKMLGVNPPSKHVVQLDDPRKAILEKYGLGLEEDAGQTKDSKS